MKLPRGLLVVAVIAGALTVAATPARATGTGRFLACGYKTTLPIVGGDSCETLPQAVADAEASGGPAVIDLLPGLYCPIDIPRGSYDLTFQGVGEAGLDTSGGPVSYSGPEAALSTFKYGGAHCKSTTIMIQASNGFSHFASLTFENLAIDGTAGPDDGMRLAFIELALRDVLVQNVSSHGIYYNGDELTVLNSAVIKNDDGLKLGSSANILQSTIAGNTTGIDASVAAVDLTLVNDSISHNSTGVSLPDTTSTVSVSNSLVGGNTTDCSGATQAGGAWETSGGYNLTGSTCVPHSPDSTDIALTTNVAAVNANGGPTPSILPPPQAQGHADISRCSSVADATDQREYEVDPSSPCDIGSVNRAADGTPAPGSSPSSLDFGSVPTNSPKQLAVTVANSGGGLAGVSGVSVSGPGFSLAPHGDNCTYAALFNSSGQSCSIGVKAGPATEGPKTGTLTVTTTGGDVSIPLTTTGIPPLTPPGKPTNTTVDGASSKVTVSWDAPADDGGQAIESYHVQYSTGGGWHDAVDSAQSPAIVKNLTNGTSYVFRVSANNGFAVGAYGDPSAAIIPHGPYDSTLLHTPPDKVIRYGQSTTISTRLTDTTTSTPISGADVALLARPAHATDYTHVDTQSTNANGVVQFHVAPTETTAYKFTYDGNWQHHLAQSYKTDVLVSSIVKASITKATVKHRHLTKIWGTVKPFGKSVELQRLVHGTYTTLPVTARVKKQRLPNHKTKVGYILEYYPKKRSHQTLRVIADDSSLNAGGLSNSLTLTVT